MVQTVALAQKQDMKTPMKVAMFALLLTQMLNLALIGGLGLGVAALALSIGLAANANAVVLIWGLRRRGSYKAAAGWPGFALRVALASAVMGAGLWFVRQRMDWLQLGDHDLQRAAALALVLLAAALAYFGTLALLGLRPGSFMRKA